MYYVYRYINQAKKIIYVGITNNLINRRNSHKYQSYWYSDELDYQYIEVPNNYIARICEIYFINLYLPCENIRDKMDCDVNLLSFNVLIWKDFVSDASNPSKDTLKPAQDELLPIQKKLLAEKICLDIFSNHQQNISHVSYNSPEDLTVYFKNLDIRDSLLNIQARPLFIEKILIRPNNDLTIKLSAGHLKDKSDYAYTKAYTTFLKIRCLICKSGFNYSFC